MSLTALSAERPGFPRNTGITQRTSCYSMTYFKLTELRESRSPIQYSRLKASIPKAETRVDNHARSARGGNRHQCKLSEFDPALIVKSERNHLFWFTSAINNLWKTLVLCTEVTSLSFGPYQWSSSICFLCTMSVAKCRCRSQWFGCEESWDSSPIWWYILSDVER